MVLTMGPDARYGERGHAAGRLDAASMAAALAKAATAASKQTYSQRPP